MSEIWKAIPVAPMYKISNHGNVMSYQGKVPRILKQKIDKHGYHTVTLSVRKNVRKSYLVHRLVLMTFNPIDDMNNKEVNHKDEDKSNNYLSNLEWSTSKENCNYGTRNDVIRHKRSKRVICVETGIIYESAKVASNLLNICRSSISNCLTGKRNKAGNYHWEEYYE